MVCAEALRLGQKKQYGLQNNQRISGNYIRQKTEMVFILSAFRISFPDLFFSFHTPFQKALFSLVQTPFGKEKIATGKTRKQEIREKRLNQFLDRKKLIYTG